MKHLVIPDVHVKPDQDFERLEWLGKYIIDTKPEVIVCLGDFADMHSLCSYDRGKKSFEGRRYHEDVEATVAAMDTMLYPLKQYNKRRAKARKKQYKPRMIMTLGNHENRINTAIEGDPVLDGTMSIDDLGYSANGWEVYPHMYPIEVDGVLYAHSFISGIMGRPIGGEHHAHSLLNKLHSSSTCGHSHLRDFCEKTTGKGERILGLVAGCYLDHHEQYAGPANELWWKGVVMKHGVNNGVYDPEFVSLYRMKEMYGE